MGETQKVKGFRLSFSPLFPALSGEGETVSGTVSP
jgi:hypothetical protein